MINKVVNEKKCTHFISIMKTIQAALAEYKYVLGKRQDDGNTCVRFCWRILDQSQSIKSKSNKSNEQTNYILLWENPEIPATQLTHKNTTYTYTYTHTIALHAHAHAHS